MDIHDLIFIPNECRNHWINIMSANIENLRSLHNIEIKNFIFRQHPKINE
jgi:hypothetical protein